MCLTILWSHPPLARLVPLRCQRRMSTLAQVIVVRPLAHAMKISAKIFALSFAFLLGIGVYHLRVLDRAAADSKTRWFVCGIHQSALRDRADQFHQKFSRWPTNVQELVEAHFLPEFSEAYFCPSQVGVGALTRTEYNDSSWVDQNRTGLVAYYGSSPHRFQIEGDKFTVICTFDKTHSQ